LGVKLKFYIDNNNDAERCGDSLRFGKPIIIEGEDPLTGRIKSYKGVILAVEQAAAEALGDRWTIAIETELAR
jgi:hypothetical protein